jgi:hypothetical protein
MKQILLTLLLGVSSICYSQDTLQIPSAELEEFFLALDTLQTQDSLKSVLISELESEIKLHEQLAQQDSLIIRYKDQEIKLLNEQIELHINYINSTDKWYKKPWVGVVGGFVGTIVLIHTIDYTLPQ